MKVKSVCAYLVLTAISVLFMLYLDGPGGSYLLTVLLLAAVLSVSLCVYTQRTVTAELSVSEDILNKKDRVTLTVSIRKRGVLPSAVLEAEFFSSDHLEAASALRVRTVCMGRGGCVLEAEFSARYFGKAKLGLSSLRVSDYLGLCSFRVPLRRSMLDIRIYPDIPDISRRDGFARSLADAAAFDDSEETSQSLFAFQGTPGYEHRLYEPGDSLKLINWKLSAKREDLYVRQPEGSSGTEQIFILDKMGGSRGAEQLAAEALLALAARFAGSELPVKLLIRFSDVWEEIPMANPSDVELLRYSLTDFSFLPDGVNRFPASFSGSRAVIFSPNAEKGLLAYMAGCAARGKDCSAAAAEITVPAERVWRIQREDAVIRFDG